MSEQLDRRQRDFSKFDSMTTEALQQILRLDAMKPTGKESDTKELLYIMEVLADRRRNDSTYTGKTTQQAFDDFQKYYMPEETDDDAADAAPTKQNKLSVLWIRRIATVAATLAIVFLTTATANAFGFDLFGKVAKWSAEFFHFKSMTEATDATEPDILDELEYTSLQAALDIHKISHHLAPTWLPDEYVLTQIDVTSTPKEIVFYACYKQGEQEIVILIRRLLTGLPIEIEKSNDFVEIYEAGGIGYYIFSNLDRLRAVWVIDEFECLITGNLSIEEVKVIIDSI